MSSPNQNPRKWRYTWEAQTHLPLLKLFIFSDQINPITDCNDLNVVIKFEKSLIIFTWKNDSPNPVSLLVPLPRVLVDLDSPLNFRPLQDHIQVKIPLLLSVDHPIVSTFISELYFGDDDFRAIRSSAAFLHPLSMDSDFKALSSKGDVDFYCRKCAYKLTKCSVRCLVDLPSVNWTDVADNWFGTCCCSFGGISEKLVAKYVKSYRCAEGTCLLTTSSVILCKDDISEFSAAKADVISSCENKGLSDVVDNPIMAFNDVGGSISVESLLLQDSSEIFYSKHFQTEINTESMELEDQQEKKPCVPPAVGSTTDIESADDRCAPPRVDNLVDDFGASISVESLLLHDSSTKVVTEHFQSEINSGSTESDEHQNEQPSCTPPRAGSTIDAESAHGCCEHDALKSSLKDLPVSEPVALQADQKSFLNCYLGNAFLFRLDGLSKDIEWIDFACPQCSCTLGAYPCSDGSEPLDGGIRLLKCNISISSSSKLSDDLFSKYTLERMFACQLLESAKDELSFRSVIKDLKTKSSMMHVVLLNPNSWCCTGWCAEGTAEPIVKINMHPVVKVLFSHCYDNPDSEPRIRKEWETKNRADEIYMLRHVIKELEKSIKEAAGNFPPSFSSSPGFLLSTIPR